MKTLTTLVAAAAVAASASTAFAGGYSEPVMVAPVVVDPGPSSSSAPLFGSLGATSGATAALLGLGAVGIAYAVYSNNKDD
ncbi:hypothetical protein AQS8620_00286 [Aquimixticola soesokkakensis]|uniref:Uncharacterized protein n=1 Tax=Aquimixticola soesokkakensis TaxID=1519096 RepID=A0A1Y5REB8_9RHOB|nr:hypothetical protein AQS8620_00286 [Aquimixticola soesokkakensis]